MTSRWASKKPPISNSKMLKGDLGGYASLQQLSMQQIIKFGLGSMKKATEYRPFQTGTTRCIVDRILTPWKYSPCLLRAEHYLGLGS